MKTILPAQSAWFILSIAAVLVSGCGGSPSPSSYETRGIVREIPLDRRTAVIRHEEIPGYMPRMTMQLTVRDTNELAGIAAGDEVTFVLHATTNTHWIDTIRKVRSGTAAGDDAPSRKSALGSPAQLKPGDLLPDAELVSEAGGPVRLSEFHGRAVALTFIFTRCPLPDFCPLMNRNFMEARRLLRADHPGTTNWQFLSISFDAEFDRPGVLSAYARNYRADDADRWLFASMARPVLDRIAPGVNLLVTSEGGSFSHNLRTVVLDPQGRVFRQFDHNAWKPADLAAAMAEAARSTSPRRP